MNVFLYACNESFLSRGKACLSTWFLIIIYLAFISLGLPDSLLGSAWPVIWPEIGSSLGSAGIVSMIIAGGPLCPVCSAKDGRASGYG